MVREMIQKTLDYVDSNVKEDITAEQLAEVAGYSVFHFYRLFQSAVGIPVMQYVLRRKLLYVIYEIGLERKKNEVVYEYGFETYSGFYRAFIREIGYTPAQYLREYKAKRPYKINIFQEEHIMVSNKLISEVLVNWGHQDEKVSDIVFPETREISDCAKYVGNNMVIKYTANLGSVKKATQISKALNSVGLTAPLVIPTTDGKEYVTVGELYFTLSQKVEGERVMASGLYLDDYKDKARVIGEIVGDDYKEKARFIGEIVGQLDLALAKIDTIADEADLGKSVREWAVPALKGKIDMNPEAMEKYATQFCNLYRNLPHQVIHRDPNPSNIILAKDKWGFIDFELSEENARIFDPCYAATAILSETFEEGNEDKLLTWVEVMKEIMYGYDSVVKLTDAEKNAIPYMILANQFVSTAFFAGKDKYEELYRTNKAMTEWIGRNMEKLSIS